MKYFRAVRRIHAGFGVSGNEAIPRGTVGKIIEDGPWVEKTVSPTVADIVGIGRRNIITDKKRMEEITEKEYFIGALRG